jgi:HD superfamily phosphohydrolase
VLVFPQVSNTEALPTDRNECPDSARAAGRREGEVELPAYTRGVTTETPADPLFPSDPAPDVEPVAETRSDRPAKSTPSSAGSHYPPPRQEFFIPIHGFVWLYDEEKAVVDHPAVQRLGAVYQLGQTHLVYRGATHTRFEHSLGTLQVAQQIMDSLVRNAGGPQANREGEWSEPQPFTEIEMRLVRLGSLLHDIAHLPAGHTLEDELGLVAKHDSLRRLFDVFSRVDWPGWPEDSLTMDRGPASGVDPVRPSLAKLIDAQYHAHLPGLPEDVRPSDLVLLLVAKADGAGAPTPPAGGSDAEWERLLVVVDALRRSPPFGIRLKACADVIGNTICADLLDYLHRDWHHLGKPKYFDVRLLQYMELRQRIRVENRPVRDGEWEFLINLRGAQKVRTDAVSVILDLLESRYQLNEIALFHKTKLGAAAMLERIVAELATAYEGRQSGWVSDLARHLLDTSDAQMLEFLDRSASDVSTRSRETRRRLVGVRRAIADLQMRKLFKGVYPATGRDIVDPLGELHERYSGGSTPALEDGSRGGLPPAARRRLDTLRKLEEDLWLRPVSLAMYFPPRAMNTKIAGVNVLVDGRRYTLDDYERSRRPGSAHRDPGLTGGHLAAQEERFARLWRVGFFVARDQYDAIAESPRLQILVNTIHGNVMRQVPPGSSLDAVSFANSADFAELVGWRAVRRDQAAKSKSGRPLVRYPSGALTIRSQLEPPESPPGEE